MANFKRKRPRTKGAKPRTPRDRRKNHYDWNRRGWMQSWPAWWDIVFHTRPARREANAVTRKVQQGVLDVDAAIWPVNKKPHKYYW